MGGRLRGESQAWVGGRGGRVRHGWEVEGGESGMGGRLREESQAWVGG